MQGTGGQETLLVDPVLSIYNEDAHLCMHTGEKEGILPINGRMFMESPELRETDWCRACSTKAESRIITREP